MVKEFRLSDKVQFRRVICFVTGRRASGHFVLVTLHGTRIHDSAKATYRKGGAAVPLRLMEGGGLLAEK